MTTASETCSCESFRGCLKQLQVNSKSRESPRQSRHQGLLGVSFRNGLISRSHLDLKVNYADK